MRRFSLRSILLVAAILPPLLAAVWYWFDFGKVHAGGEGKAARKMLLAHTPPGSSPDTVLDFVVNKLHRNGQGDAYYKYLRAYEASTGKMDNQLTAADLITAPRTISVVVSSRPSSFMIAHEVSATWHFDDQDRLVDITTMEYGIGP